MLMINGEWLGNHCMTGAKVRGIEKRQAKFCRHMTGKGLDHRRISVCLQREFNEYLHHIDETTPVSLVLVMQI